MKILSIQYGNINNPYSHGGLANLLHESFKRMAARHTITCFTGLLKGKTRKAEIDGVTYVRKGLGHNKYVNRFSFFNKNSFFKPNGEYDLILTPWDRYAPVLLTSGNCPVVLELNLDFFSVPSKLPAAEWVTRYFLEWKIKKSRYMLCMSEGVKKIALQYAETAKLCEVMPGGVPEALFSYPVNPEDEDHLLYIGRLDISHKGIDILLKAYKASGTDVPLVIAGDGADKKEVETMIRRLGLEEKATTVGWVRGEEKYDLLSRSLAVCMPSRSEGWGIAATEAAAFGKPVLGTKVVGLEEAVTDGKTGILVEKDCVDAFAGGIKTITGNKTLRRGLGQQAKEEARPFTWERLSEKREHFFYQVIEDFQRLQRDKGNEKSD
ncbi:MAG: glycosyltransferase family 4 protein [bacterium]|nr:glycosyltransferase family 4 protein [bacterium]